MRPPSEDHHRYNGRSSDCHCNAGDPTVLERDWRRHQVDSAWRDGAGLSYQEVWQQEAIVWRNESIEANKNCEESVKEGSMQCTWLQLLSLPLVLCWLNTEPHGATLSIARIRFERCLHFVFPFYSFATHIPQTASADGVLHSPNSFSWWGSWFLQRNRFCYNMISRFVCLCLPSTGSCFVVISRFVSLSPFYWILFRHDFQVCLPLTPFYWILFRRDFQVRLPLSPFYWIQFRHDF